MGQPIQLSNRVELLGTRQIALGIRHECQNLTRQKELGHMCIGITDYYTCATPKQSDI